MLFGGNGSTPGTGTVRGATTSTTLDLCLARYVDQGSSATLAWTQVGGGTNQDFSGGVAVSGTSVYVTGSLWNNQANANEVLFSGNGTTTSTATVRGASATASSGLLLAKYTDNGSSSALGWTQVGGGTSYDVATSGTTSGTSVYVSATFVLTWPTPTLSSSAVTGRRLARPPCAAWPLPPALTRCWPSIPTTVARPPWAGYKWAAVAARTAARAWL